MKRARSGLCWMPAATTPAPPALSPVVHPPLPMVWALLGQELEAQTVTRLAAGHSWLVAEQGGAQPQGLT